LSDGNVWRGPQERKDLVERLIKAEKANRLLEDELRARVRAEEAFLAGHPSEAALLARVAELEGIVVRLNEKLTRRRAS
jgi:hypothetical protein